LSDFSAGTGRAVVRRLWLRKGGKVTSPQARQPPVRRRSSSAAQLSTTLRDRFQSPTHIATHPHSFDLRPFREESHPRDSSFSAEAASRPPLPRAAFRRITHSHLPGGRRHGRARRGRPKNSFRLTPTHTPSPNEFSRANRWPAWSGRLSFTPCSAPVTATRRAQRRRARTSAPASRDPGNECRAVPGSVAGTPTRMAAWSVGGGQGGGCPRGRG
jgi:hypothetical protein